MPRAEAARELPFPREDVWGLVAQPLHFPDWWPGLAGVQPDRRGLAPGARWVARRSSRPGLLRAGGAEGVLVVHAVEPPERLAWHLTLERLDAELLLEEAGPARTRAVVSVHAPWRAGLRRGLPQQALGRLEALCQTLSALD